MQVLPCNNVHLTLFQPFLWIKTVNHRLKLGFTTITATFRAKSKMGESFTNFQRRMWLMLAFLGVVQYYIDVNTQGQYVIRRGIIGRMFLWIYWTNTLFKFIYHVLIYNGFLVEVHFLDQMSIWDWFLMYFHVLIECMVWNFKYPMWENLYRQWELQEDIYRKLGKPVHVAKKIIRTDTINLIYYGGVCVIGTGAYIVQFLFTPKYALNTYAVVPADNMLLRIIFCLHECMFMFPGYLYQAFTMVLAESFAVSYQHLLEEMNKVLTSLLKSQTMTCGKGRVIASKVRHSESLKRNGHTDLLQLYSSSTPINKNTNLNPVYTSPVANLNTIAPEIKYDIQTLLADYKKISLSAQFHNQWIGKVMGLPQGINYAQFVCDVFMLIQLLKEPDTDYFGVFFYIMDAVFGMGMIFRMLIITSRLYPQGETFIQGLKTYATLNTPDRKSLLKTIPALRTISAKLIGYSVKPQSVTIGVNVLIKWYIAAGMWQRPDDPSRIT